MKCLLTSEIVSRAGNCMTEKENTSDKKKKDKIDYAEVEFEIGNIEFEAKGKSLVVERMFRLLLEKIEQGKLVATLRLMEYEEEEEEEEEEEFEEEEDSTDLSGTTKDSTEEPTTTDDILSEPIPEDTSFEKPAIPSEAYLDPPSWESLDEISPPESDVEKRSSEDLY